MLNRLIHMKIIGGFIFYTNICHPLSCCPYVLELKLSFSASRLEIKHKKQSE